MHTTSLTQTHAAPPASLNVLRERLVGSGCSLVTALMYYRVDDMTHMS